MDVLREHEAEPKTYNKAQFWEEDKEADRKVGR